MSDFLRNDELHQSPVVPNRTMNRERQLTGVNSYEKDVSFPIVDFLASRTAGGRSARWLDIACGSALALVQACRRLPGVAITGIDLVPFFHPDVELADVTFHVCPVEDFDYPARYDLITSVHGLHYVGDKLRVVADAIASLSKDGVFVANMNLVDLSDENGHSIGRRVIASMRRQGVRVDQRKRIVSCEGPKVLSFPVVFHGPTIRWGQTIRGSGQFGLSIRFPRREDLTGFYRKRCIGSGTLSKTTHGSNFV